jgi:ABC-2 type transport system permease protein
MLALGFGLGPVYAKAGGGNYLDFIVPGIITMSILFTAIFGGMEIIWDRQFGFLKETLVAPVSRFHIVFGRVLGGATVAALQGVIVMFLSMLLKFYPTNWLLVPPAIVVMFIIAILFSALGTAIASVLEDMQGFQLIMNFMVMPIFFFSGALFPLAGLPPALAVVARINPLTYGVDSLRGLLIAANHFSLITSTSILVAITLVLLLLASYLFNRMEV